MDLLAGGRGTERTCIASFHVSGGINAQDPRTGTVAGATAPRLGALLRAPLLGAGRDRAQPSARIVLAGPITSCAEAVADVVDRLARLAASAARARRRSAGCRVVGPTRREAELLGRLRRGSSR